MIALYVLVLVLALLWLGAGALTRRLWSTYFVPERGISRRVRVIGGGMLLLLWLFVPFYFLYGRTALLDAEVRELCAKDGGVKVYETVRLPAERFDQYGNIGIRSRQHARPTDDHFFDVEEKYLRTGNPTLVRYVVRIIRRSDGKVLGESIRYGRGGGDMPGPWHPSTFDCPSIRDLSLESAIFMPGGKK